MLTDVRLARVIIGTTLANVRRHTYIARTSETPHRHAKYEEKYEEEEEKWPINAETVFGKYT